MRPETFLEKFDLIADAPGAVGKMRELVLELAVMGKLVPHLDHEKPIPYSSKEGVPINRESVPANWRVVLLADAIKNRSGNSKLIKGKLHDEPANGRFQGFSASGADVWCNNYEHEGSAIIISAVGARCGKAFKATGKWSAIANTNIAFPDDALLDFDFAYLILNNEHFWVRGGSAQPFVKFPPSLNRHYALPPLAEQKRIVAKVDELMALCDRLEQQQNERDEKHAALSRASLTRFSEAPTPENLNLLFHPSYTTTPADLRKTILTLAVQGKLVPQDPNDEPAEKIITKVEILRPDAVDDSVNNNDGPWSLPSSWSWVRLGKIAMIKHGYAFSSASFTSVPTPYVLTTPGNFYESGGFRDRGDKTKYFKGEVPHSFVFDAGDLIIPMTEQAAGLLGSPAFIPDDGKTYLHNQRLGKLDFYSNEILPAYVFCFFNDEFFRSELARTCTGMKVRHTSPKRVLNVPFALPPLAEQKRIVAKVDELMKLVDQLEEQLTTARTTAENLLNALLADLTSQKAA
jgi:type I restriction enzyme S subunit